MRTLEELNLVDDFLVNSLTSHKIYGEQSARYILECILHRQIGKLTVVPQRFFCGENQHVLSYEELPTENSVYLKKIGTAQGTLLTRPQKTAS